MKIKYFSVAFISLALVTPLIGCGGNRISEDEYDEMVSEKDQIISEQQEQIQKLNDHIANLEEKINEIDSQVQNFEDQNWREVVPEVEGQIDDLQNEVGNSPVESEY